MSVITQRSILGHLHASKIRNVDWRKVFLACGVASSLLYVAMDAVSAWLYDGYSYTGQTISELSAIGAPTRWLWVPLSFLYSLLTIAFGFGIWASAGRKRALRVVAALVMTEGILGFVAWPFAPMHQREVLAAGGATFSDTLHLILSAVHGLTFTLSVAFAAAALGKRFRLFSIATLVIVFVFAALMNLETPNVQDNESTPWIGVTERIMLLASLLWYAALAVVLFRFRGMVAARGSAHKPTDCEERAG